MKLKEIKNRWSDSQANLGTP